MTNVLFISSEQPDIEETLTEEASRHGWHLRVVLNLSKDAVMHGLQPLEAKSSDSCIGKRISELLDFWKPAGCIVEKCPELDCRFFRRIPCVFIGRDPRSFPKGCDELNILHDTEETVRLAANELMRPGVRHFGWAGYLNNWYWNREREESFSRIVRLNGKTLHSFRTPFTPSSPVDSIKLLRKWIKALPKPCGIFVANDYLGERVLSACADEAINVPGDVSVVSVDDIPRICNNTKPPMTSVSSDFRLAARMAADLLAEKLANPGLRRAIRRFAPNGITRRLSSGIVFDSHVAAMSEMIRTQTENGLKARDVFKRLKCSRRYAELRFRAQTGHTILDAIRERRINLARELLAGNKKLSLDEIASRCGYARPESLYKAFRAVTGLSPSAWRRRYN